MLRGRLEGLRVRSLVLLVLVIGLTQNVPTQAEVIKIITSDEFGVESYELAEKTRLIIGEQQCQTPPSNGSKVSLYQMFTELLRCLRPTLRIPTTTTTSTKSRRGWRKGCWQRSSLLFHSCSSLSFSFCFSYLLRDVFFLNLLLLPLAIRNRRSACNNRSMCNMLHCRRLPRPLRERKRRERGTWSTR